LDKVWFGYVVLFRVDAIIFYKDEKAHDINQTEQNETENLDEVSIPVLLVFSVLFPIGRIKK
jgi:hypothetical protein